MMRNYAVFAQFSKATHRVTRMLFCLALFALGLSQVTRAQEARVITFDAPGAGTSAGQGTSAQGINPQGQIAGWYLDNNNVYRGFVRDKGGDIATFDAPGAGLVGTLPYGINPEGAIAGFYFDSNYVSHGFVRDKRGAITTFDAPGAVATYAAQINPSGVIAGDYRDASNVSHAYVRTPDGNISIFDAPGAGTGAGQGTMTGFIDCINPEGAMTGYYLDASNVFHGYLRAPGGSIITFDAPGADTKAGDYNGTYPGGINLWGAITGAYQSADTVFHGFIRSRDGKFAVFDAPGADLTPGNSGGTFPQTINLLGAITGYYRDANNVYHGFVRQANGAFRNFQIPGADTTPGSYNGTLPSGINDAGAVTGAYYDAQSVAHGFLLIPEE